MFGRLWIWKISFAFYYGVWLKLCERSRDVWKWLPVSWPSWLMLPLFFTILIEILKKTYDANFPHLQPVVKLRRNQRGEIVCQHVKAHSCSHFSPCFDHSSPNQTDDGISRIDHDIGAYVPYSFRTMSRVLLRPLPTGVQGWRRQGQQLNATTQWHDHLNWERGFSHS